MDKKQPATAPDNTAVIYGRYSSNNQREESLDAQIRACREYAKKNNFEIVKIYTDAAKTGTNSNREQFQLMIEESGKKLFKHLIIHKLDRFSRNKYDSAIYKMKLKDNGIKLHSVTENLDGSPESIILESLLEGMAQYYSINLGREAMKGMKESAYNCTHLGGFAPLGYDVDPVTKKYIINKPEAKIVEMIFDKYAGGIGYNQILAYLNGKGYLTKQGNPFGKNSLHSILKNEKYTGTFIFNQRQEKSMAGKRNPKRKPEEEIIRVKGGMPAIVDMETFNKVQEKMVKNLKNGGRHKAKEVYLLSGLIYCGECESSMSGNTRLCGRNKSKYSSYRCSDRAQHKGCCNKELRKEYLENYVLDELYNKLFSDVSIKKLSSMLNDYNQKKSVQNNEELTSANTQLAEVIKKISTIINLVSEAGVSIDTVKSQLKELEVKKEFLEGYIAELTLKNTENMISEEVICQLINNSREFILTKNLPECRSFIENYIEKVLVYKDRVEVLFKVNIPDNNGHTINQVRSQENIKALQKEYRAG